VQVSGLTEVDALFAKGLGLFEFSDGGGIVTFFQETVGDPVVGAGEIGIDFDSPAEFGDGLVVAAREEEFFAQVGGDDVGERIELLSFANLDEGVVDASHGNEIALGVPVMSGSRFRE